MLPLLLRNLEIHQTHVCISSDLGVLISVDPHHPEGSSLLDRVTQHLSTFSADEPTETFLSVLESETSIRGALIDLRPQELPIISVSPHCFILIQMSDGKVRPISGTDGQHWTKCPLASSTLRVVGGSGEWEQDLGLETMQDILRETPREETMTKLLFTLSRERHCLGFDEPSPFLFGISHLTRTGTV